MSANGSEKKLFGEIVRNQTKYGTTTHPMPRFSRYVKHVVSRVDTLQGIALKYGVTVEQIKRENKLWTNDSLFLREKLYIPVSVDNTHLVQDDWELLSSDEVRSRSKSELLTSASACNNEPHDNKSDSSNANEPQVSNGGKSSGGTAMDFFSKYDSNIADIKSKVETLEKSSRHRDENLSSLIPRRHSDTAASSRPSSRRISVEDPDSPVLVIRSNMKSTKVKTAVERSEKANDDLFEL